MFPKPDQVFAMVCQIIAIPPRIFFIVDAKLFIPLVTPAFYILFVVVVVLLIRWQVKFGALNSTDPDYQVAKRSWMVSLVMMIVAAPLGFIVRPLVEAILYFRFNSE